MIKISEKILMKQNFWEKFFILSVSVGSKHDISGVLTHWNKYKNRIWQQLCKWIASDLCRSSNRHAYRNSVFLISSYMKNAAYVIHTDEQKVAEYLKYLFNGLFLLKTALLILEEWYSVVAWCGVVFSWVILLEKA